MLKYFLLVFSKLIPSLILEPGVEYCTQKTVSGLPPRLLMFVLSLAFVDPVITMKVNFGPERDDELSKLAIVLLFIPRIGQLQRG